jgi:hypothetical protein
MQWWKTRQNYYATKCYKAAAQAVADYKERVKSKVDTAGWSMLSPMLTPYQTEDVMNQIKELLDTTN